MGDALDTVKLMWITYREQGVEPALEHMAEDIGQDVYAKLAGQPADRAALAAKIAAAAPGTRGGGSR